MKTTIFSAPNYSSWLNFPLKINFYKQLQFWLETIEQCRKIFQTNPSHWQQIGRTLTPANFIVKETPASEINTYDFRQRV